MIKLLGLFVALVVLSLNKPAFAHPADTSTATKRPYDVLGYKLLLDWRQISRRNSRFSAGPTRLLLSLPTQSPQVVVDAAEMKIDLVSVNGTALSTTPQPLSELLFIPIPQDLRHKGTTLDLQIAYTHTKADSPIRQPAACSFIRRDYSSVLERYTIPSLSRKTWPTR